MVETATATRQSVFFEDYVVRQTFSPLTEVLPERTTPELLYLEANSAEQFVSRL